MQSKVAGHMDQASRRVQTKNNEAPRQERLKQRELDNACMWHREWGSGDVDAVLLHAYPVCYAEE